MELSHVRWRVHIASQDGVNQEVGLHLGTIQRDCRVVQERLPHVVVSQLLYGLRVTYHQYCKLVEDQEVDDVEEECLLDRIEGFVIGSIEVVQLFRCWLKFQDCLELIQVLIKLLKLQGDLWQYGLVKPALLINLVSIGFPELLDLHDDSICDSIWVKYRLVRLLFLLALLSSHVIANSNVTLGCELS